MHEAPWVNSKEGGSTFIIFPLAHSGKPLCRWIFKLLPEQKAPSATRISRAFLLLLQLWAHSLMVRCSGTVPGPYPWGFFEYVQVPNLKPFWETAAMELKSHDPQRHAETLGLQDPWRIFFIPLKKRRRIWSGRQLQEFESSVPIMAMSFDNDVTLGGWLHHLFVPQFPHL